MKITKFIEDFEKYLKLKNMSDSTIKVYCSLISKFILTVQEYPQRVSKQDVEKYILKINSPRTRNQTIGCLKTFFKKIVNRPNIVDIPYAKVPDNNPVFISKEKFELSMENCLNYKHRLIFRLMFNHGLRVGEVVNCKIGWFGSQVINGVKYYTLNINGKGSKDRLICLSIETINELVNYSKSFRIDLTIKDYFLLTGKVKIKYSISSIQKLTKKYFNVNPHALRHSCATELVNRDVNQKKIQDLLGHSSSKTTEIYTHTSIKSMIGINA